MNTHTASEIDPLDPVADEFLERLRKGEHPALSEYVERYPDLADRIRELFPALVLMEKGAPSVAGAATGPFTAVVAGSLAAPLKALGDFRLLREVGHGGMGVVYEAVQESLGRHVALKVLPPALVRKRKFLERFKREARAAGRLHHTNIVPVYGVGEHDATHFIVMQFIQGHGLDIVLQDVRQLRGKPLTEIDSPAATVAASLVRDDFAAAAEPAPPPRGEGEGEGRGASECLSRPSPLPARASDHYYRAIARLGLQAANALAYAHSQGVIHRDIKPSNLLLDNQGTLWVADFGLAKADDTDDLTDTGDIVGTTRYMAPERFEGRADARSDIYALGVTLFEVLTLRPAFDEPNRLKLIERINQSGSLAPRSLDAALPRDLDTIVQKASARDAADRYQTAAELADDLQRFLDDRPIRARRTTPVEHLRRWARRNPVMAALTGAVALLLVLVTAVSLVANARLDQRAGDLSKALEYAERLRILADKKRGEAEEATAVSHKREYESYLSQLHAWRYSGLPGQRYEGLRTIRKAMQPELIASHSRLDLRNAAIASLCLPDFEVAQEWVGRQLETQAVEFDPSFARYAIGDLKGEVSIRRAGDGRELMRLPSVGRTPNYDGLHFSPDGKFLAQIGIPVAGKAENCRLWKMDGPKPTEVFREQRSVCMASFRHDSAVVALLLHGGDVVLRDTATGREVQALVPKTPLTRAIDFHPLRPNLLLMDLANQVRVVDVDTGKPVMERSIGGPASGICWHPEGDLLAFAVNRKILLVNAATGQVTIPPFGFHLNGGVQVRFNHAGDLLASTDWTSTLYLWDARTGKQLLEAPARMTQTKLQFSPDDTLLASESIGERLRLLRVEPGREFGRVLRRKNLSPKPSGGYTDMLPTARADGRLGAVSVGGGAVLVDLQRREELSMVLSRNPNCPPPIPLAYDKDGALWTGGDDIQRWPLVSHDASTQQYGPPRVVLPLQHRDQWSLSADLKVVAIPLHKDGSLVVHLGDPLKRLELGPQQDPRRCAISPDGKYVATSTHVESPIMVWDAKTGRLVKILEKGGPPQFSPDGRWLAGNLMLSNECRVWRVANWDLAAIIPQPMITGCAIFSADGALLALGGETGFIRLVRPETGEEVARLFTPDKTGLQPGFFTPDGSRLLARGVATDMLYVWDLHRIRAQLRDLDLDWEKSPPPRLAEPYRTPAPLRVKIQQQGG